MLNAKRFFLFILIFLVLTDLAILLNIPVLRQFFGFFFFSFVPGLLILYLLKLDKLGLTEKIVLSVGISISFLIFFGLAINSSLFALGYATPLSTISLLLSFNPAIIVLCIIAYLRNKNTTFSFSNIKLTTEEKVFLIVPSLLPLLSIVGTHIMNLTNNNAPLIALILAIAAYVIFISITKPRISENAHCISIYLIGISLILMFALKSSHIIGSDTHVEYILFRTALSNLHWMIIGAGDVAALLTNSLLPVIYQSLLNMDPEYLFKLLFVPLVAFIPVIIYLLSSRYIGKSYAFLAAILYISQVSFLQTPALIRQSTATLFFALTIMTLFHESINELPKRVLFIIFAASAIVSHYSTSYIFFFMLLLLWAGMQILQYIVSRKKKPTIQSENPMTQGPTPESKAASIRTTLLKKRVSVLMIGLFFLMVFFWYSQVTQTPFDSGVRYGWGVLKQLNEFFLLSARSPVIQAALGASPLTEGVAQRIKFVASWGVVIFIGLGVLAAIVRFRQMISIPYTEHRKPDFLLRKFEAEFFILSLVSLIVMVLAVALPYATAGYALSRIDFVAKILLSMFFVIGGITVGRILRITPHWLILLVLIPFFLSTTGVLYVLDGNQGRTLTLATEGYYYDTMIIHDQESYAATWIQLNTPEETLVWIEQPRMFKSQSLIEGTRLRNLAVTCGKNEKINGYIYLRRINVVDGKYYGIYGDSHDLLEECPNLLIGKNKIYSNGGSEIYR